MQILFLKAHVKGYTRKDGTFVKDHVTKAPAAAPKATPKAAGKKAWPSWDKDFKTAKEAGAKPPKAKKPAVIVAPQFGQGSLFGGGGAAPAKPSYPDAVLHPRLGDDGKPFKINEPSTASAPESWTDPAAIALWTPDSAVPTALNGVPFAPWTDHPVTEEGWDYVDGQMDDLDEPAMETNGKAPAAGVIVEEPDGRVWLVRPSNGFAGYRATFPKGHADEGMSLQATAIKEAFEESGLKVAITGYVGDVERTQTMTRYYRARRVGGSPAAMGWETQGVALVPPAEVASYVNQDVDRVVAGKAGLAPAGDGPESMDGWTKVGGQKGSNDGGFFKDPAGVEWYCKLPKTSNIAKNEVLASKLYAAAGVEVPELKHVTMGGKLGVASRVIPGLHVDPAALKKGKVPGANDSFAVDAWLANWDVVGLLYDNLMLDEAGHAVRVDVGGSLVFRAQGEPKGAAFGPKVGELSTLIDGKNPQSTAVFGKISHAQVVEGIQKVEAVPDDLIRQLCDEYGPGDKDQRAKLASTLLSRKAYLVAHLPAD